MNKVPLEHASNAANSTGLAAAPDNEVLLIYTNTGDSAAAEVLIERYAAMVATVCRATVSDYQAAEDAFQITFTVLLQSAGSIRSGVTLGPWLHSVAYRSACRVRKKLMRDSHQEIDPTILPDTPLARELDPAELIARQVELETLSEELERLPHRLRTVVVEHHLLGRSAPDIARELDVALTTVEGRLRRGRQVLRRQLASRGISMSTLMASSRYMQRSVAGCDAASWTQSFVQSGLSLRSRTGDEDGDSSDGRRRLDKGDLVEISSQLIKDFSMFSTASWKLVSGVALACGIGVTAVCWAASGIGGQAPQSTSNSKMTLASEPATPTQARMQLPARVPTQGTVAWQRPEGGSVPHWAQGNSAEEAFYELAQEKLREKVDASYPGQPLLTVVTAMSDQMRIPIWINTAELEAFGVASDAPVTLDLPKQVSLRSALKIMLAPLELTFIVRNEVLEITSIDDADADPTVRQYDLAYLLPNSSSVEAVHKVIHYSVMPDGWQAFGGHSSIVQIGSMMVVSAPQTTHFQVEQLLMKLARMSPANAQQASEFHTLDNFLPPTSGPGKQEN